MAEATLAPRVPPNSTEAEQSVIGALLLDNRVADQLGGLRPEQFYRLEHREVFAATMGLISAGRPADAITVFEAMEASGKGDLVSMLILTQLTQSLPSVQNAGVYAGIVRELAQRRALVALADDIAAAAYRGRAEAPTQAIIDNAIGSLLALQAGRHEREPQQLGVVLAAFLDDLTDRFEGKVLSYETGLADLDEITAGGGRPGELWVIGARPSMGKTAFTLQLCRHVSQRRPVLFLSQEDSQLAAAARFVAAQGGVNLADLRAPQKAPQSIWAGVTDAIGELKGRRVWIDDTRALTLAAVRRKIRQVQRTEGDLALVVIDYLQLMDADGSGENRNQALGALANGLNALAGELGLWIVLLSQLSRKADERTGVPQIGDLRDSGDIEGAAHVIGLLHREHRRKPTTENKHWAQIHLAKQKNGPTDTINLYFDGALQRFADWDGPVPFNARGSSGQA